MTDGSTSDGHHTFDELYFYRMLYNAHAAHGWLAQGIPVVKSWRHADGEECFGGGWFIVTATLPAGQVSNHYESKHWGLFKVPEVDLPPEWDGHTPEDATARLRIEAERARPQPRTITTSDEMDALPFGAVVLSDKGQAWQKVHHRAGFMSTGGWLCADPIYPGIYNDPDMQKGAIFYDGPATVLYLPEVDG